MQDTSGDERLRLTWRRTWVSEPQDFSCHAPEADMSQIVGRVYFEYTPRMEPGWRWYCHARTGDQPCPAPYTGRVETKMEAARMVEAKWFEMLAWAQSVGLRRKDPYERDRWNEIDAHNLAALGRG